jgi:hypothetical protein
MTMKTPGQPGEVMSHFPRTLLFFITFILFTHISASALAEPAEPGLNESSLQGLAWRGIGPALMAGRVADIAVHPENRSIWYVGVGSGGVWKTINRGIT